MGEYQEKRHFLEKKFEYAGEYYRWAVPLQASIRKSFLDRRDRS